MLTYDGSPLWDGDYVPEAGLFGQRSATCKRIVLCAHEFEALRVATAIENSDKLNGTLHAVALTVPTGLGRLGTAMVIDSLKVVADEVVVWSATAFLSLREPFEVFLTDLDGCGLNVGVYALSRMTSPLDMTDGEIEAVLLGAERGWSPSVITSADEIFESERFFEPMIGYSTGIKKLDEFIKGIRKSELTMYVAGTGVGKSTLLRQQVYHLAYNEGQTCALAFFEETREETLKNLACVHYGVSFVEMRKNPHLLSDKQWQDFLNLDATKNLIFITQNQEVGFGGLGVDTLMSTIRYLKSKRDIDFVAVDHISIMISGEESSREGERKDIDRLMTKMALGCVTLKVGILAICHLSNPVGKKAHEEGGRVFLQHLRGSGAIRQLSWCVIAQERDQQSDGASRLVLIRVLKNRNGGGSTGPATILEYTDPLLVERDDLDVNEFANVLDSTENKKKKKATKWFGESTNTRRVSLGDV